MKQHITENDLKQLSEKGLKKLLEWWQPDEDDLVVNGTDEYHLSLADVNNQYCKLHNIPLLSIGQMLEFLDEQEELPSGDYVKNKYRIDIAINGNEELCDHLWKTVKEVLNK